MPLAGSCVLKLKPRAKAASHLQMFSLTKMSPSGLSAGAALRRQAEAPHVITRARLGRSFHDRAYAYAVLRLP